MIGSTTAVNLRFIIRFDLSNIVLNTVNVDQAYLTLTTASTREGAFNIIAYPVTNEWIEGTAVSQTDPDDGVTWINRTTLLLWSTQGGDYNSSKPSASISVPAGTFEKVTIPLSADIVKNWISNPDSNYGVIIIGSKENLVENNYTFFYTSEYTIMTYRPKLTLYLKP